MKTKLFTCFALHLALADVVAQPIIPPNEPGDQTAIAGGTATFSVNATGTPPLAYQWRRYTNSTTYGEISGATNNVYLLTNAQATSHRFAVVVCDSTGCNTSRQARLTVAVPVRITSQPRDVSAVAGEAYALSVGATGTPSLSFQWNFNGRPLIGANSSNLAFPIIQFSNAGAYQVIVTNLYGAATSQVATLTVLPPTLFTRVPNGPVATDLGQTGGFVWADFDNDGFLDLYATQYWSPTNFYYHNNGDGTFSRVHGESFLITSGYNFDASAADYDNDGWLDMIVTTAGASPIPRPVVLFHNDHGGRFSRVSAGGVTNAVGYFPDAQWADYDNDGFVDLLITQNDATESGASTNLLWHNNGDGSFQRVTSGPLVADRMSGWGVHWIDYDDDGLMDAFISNSANGHNFLYHNRGPVGFERVTNSPVSLDVFTSGFNPPAAFGDFDNDGWPDLFVADGGALQNHLYHNERGGGFANVVNSAVLSQPAGSNGRGCVWGDYDNDGYLDLLIEYFDRVVIFRNTHDGNFSEMTSLAPTREQLPDSNSFLDDPAWVDYDNDGFLDLYVSVGNLVAPLVRNRLYHNAGNSNTWLEVKCVGTVANRAAIGTKVRAKATIGGIVVWQLRDIRSAGGAGLIAHFGLGDATNVETLRIEWPSGTVQEITNVAPRQILTITEPPRLTVTEPTDSRSSFSKVDAT